MLSYSQHLLRTLWVIKESATVKKTRMEVLLHPPPISPIPASSKSLDKGSPGWNSQARNTDEQAELAEEHEKQETVARQMQGRHDFDNSDFTQVLKGMGENWAANLPMVEMAVNSTFQNLQVSGEGRLFKTYSPSASLPPLFSNPLPSVISSIIQPPLSPLDALVATLRNPSR